MNARECKVCGNIHSRKKGALYCSKKCKNYAWYHLSDGKNKKKQYAIDNADKIKAKERRYIENGTIKAKNKRWYSKNGKEYYRNRKNTDIKYKLTTRIRTRLYKVLKNNAKAGSAIKDLGCSVEELKKHLESQFKLGMSWDNWTTDGWHIDHIKPLSSFDLTDRKQFKQACHYTNLQPLWAEENIAKSDKEIV